MGKRKKTAGGKGRRRPPEGARVVTFNPAWLSRIRPVDAGPDPRWVAFAETCKGHTALRSDTIYALPEPLIDAIAAEIPDFWNEEEEHFERDLARLGGAGFFLKRSFSYQFLPGPKLAEEEARVSREMDERQTKAAGEIRQLMSGSMRECGRRDYQIEAYWTAEEQMLERFDARKWGYAGWLVTHPEFHRACDLFRRKWKSKINKLRGFPVQPMSFFGEVPPDPQEEDRRFYEAYTRFCQSWALHSFATWELPIPMRPELAHPSLYHLPALNEGGITLFVPWYLLRDADLKLRELTEHHLAFTPQPHLKEWLEGKPKNWGYDRYAVMLRVYIHLELSLKARYADKLKGCTGDLDYALGRFLCETPSIMDAEIREAENIRKIRLAMNRRLKECATA